MVTAIFIDGGYLDKVIEYIFNRTRIDYVKLADKISGNQLRTYYYHCPPYLGNPPTEEEESRYESKRRFFSALGYLPRFQVRLGQLVYRGNNQTTGRPIYQQKLVDVMLSVDMTELAATRQVQRVALVAGDSDFVPAVQSVKSHGVLVSLYHGPISGGDTHSQLWEVCDERHELTREMIDSIKRV
jgi:uncharacterized LabA/DUF88 family protein